MITRSRRTFIAAVVIVLAVITGAAQGQSALSLGPLFQDHAVFQRDKPIPVWGTAGPGDEVTVAFAGNQASARADASGRWTATLPATAAGGPHSLEVRTTSGATRTLSDILVGDVFLCSGQSNMEFGVAQSRGGEFVAARSANDKIRLLTIAHAATPQPATAFEKAPAWQRAGPQSLRTFSAACYFFGRDVHETQNVPVGLVNAAWGGSAIEPWIGERACGPSAVSTPVSTCCGFRARRGDGQPELRAAVGGVVAAATARPPANRGSPRTRARGPTCPGCGTGRRGACRSSPATTAWCGTGAPSA